MSLRENLDTSYGSFSVDDEDQLQPSDTLDGGGDPLDAGYDAPDRLRGSTAWGITPEEMRREETIDQRIRQEEEDPDSAYGAPHNESGLDTRGDRLGGDDPDSIRAEDDYYGGGRMRVGRLVAPDEGSGWDDESDAVAREGRWTRDDTAEEAAMHYIDGDEEDDND